MPLHVPFQHAYQSLLCGALLDESPGLGSCCPCSAYDYHGGNTQCTMQHNAAQVCDAVIAGSTEGVF
jgi:hypothetical protein